MTVLDVPIGHVSPEQAAAWWAGVQAKLGEFDDAPEDIKARIYATVAARVHEIRGRIDYDRKTAEVVAQVRAWRDLARPDQLPPDGPWRTAYLRGGRGSGKTWPAARWFAEDMLDHPGGEWGIIGPTFSDARELCIEGPSGLLSAFHTTVADVEAGRSPLVARWNRSSNQGELYLRPEVGGGIVYIGGAKDGALAVNGKNLRALWGDEVGMWAKWRTAWKESIRFAVRHTPAHRIATGTPKRNLPARELVRLLMHGDDTTPAADVQRRLRTLDNLHNLDPEFAAEMRALADVGGSDAAQELEGELLDGGGIMFDRSQIEIVDDWPREARLCRRWDFAATAVKPTASGKRADDPDWTVGLLLGVHEGVWFVIDVVRARANPGDVRQLVVSTRDRDREQYPRLMVRMEQEPGSSGKTVVDSYTRGVFVGDNFAGVPSTGSKIVRAEPVAAAAAAGNLKVVRGGWNAAFLDELEMFPDVTHDDQVDGLSGAFTDLSRPARVPGHMRFRRPAA